MQITFTLDLPRDEASVPVVRHLCRDALTKLGVESNCVSDIEIAVTEACSNVLHHAGESEDEYEVSVEISETRCEIRVKDTGAGDFEHEGVGLESSGMNAESGRGVFLMRAFVDDLRFVSEPEVGTIVHLVKQLKLIDDAPLRKLTALERMEARTGSDGAAVSTTAKTDRSDGKSPS